MGEKYRRKPRTFPLQKAKGISYVEVLIAIVLIVTALVPAMQALQPAMISSNSQQSLSTSEQLLKSKMEELLAAPYDALDQAIGDTGNTAAASLPEPYSDPAGGVIAHAYRYITVPPTPELIWLQVELPTAATKLTTLRSR